LKEPPGYSIPKAHLFVLPFSQFSEATLAT
jgi:hypothetical protein